ncbi:hypothetical protein QPL79_03635 [Ignisphaera sp. 4213-co]|uniref:Uncharacterized protein n=1 Tax=Ignisphaera cupida TaxID=3050454 RepID=A0ABD4Z554_9CREN|nr:hypothetical protein [Ignisphaera sp. 4213-co]MDK6028447.1 hypothetical protein [Ignisphaera sp. 4213-co]
MSSENIKDNIGEDLDRQEKVDLKKLLAVVPPPSEILSKKKQGIREKRLRLLYDSSVNEDEAKISPSLAKELGIKEFIEITVAGKKRFRLKVRLDDAASSSFVYVNPDLMKRNGIADNSICTIRAL